MSVERACKAARVSVDASRASRPDSGVKSEERWHQQEAKTSAVAKDVSSSRQECAGGV